MSVSQEGGQSIVGIGRRRRRSWSAAEKRRIVAETFAPGASVSIVARRHDVNANMLFTWRREMAVTAAPAGENAVKFVPATIAAAAIPTAAPMPLALPGRMEIVFSNGDRVIVGADVDTAALARVMKVLGQR